MSAALTKGLKPAKPRASLKTARKRAGKAAERFSGDTGTKEMKLRQTVLIEARVRSLRGEPTVVGARVEALARIGLPVQIMLYGGDSHSHCLKMIEGHMAKEGLPILDQRREDFTIKEPNKH
jgi:hypothetical protein